MYVAIGIKTRDMRVRNCAAKMVGGIRVKDDSN